MTWVLFNYNSYLGYHHDPGSRWRYFIKVGKTLFWFFLGEDLQCLEATLLLAETTSPPHLEGTAHYAEMPLKHIRKNDRFQDIKGNKIVAL